VLRSLHQITTQSQSLIIPQTPITGCNTMNPVIAITMGDPAGIGPEVIVKLFAGLRGNIGYTPVVIGDTAVLHETARRWHPCLEVVSAEADGRGFREGVLPVLAVQGLERTAFHMGTVNPWCGDISYRTVAAGVKLALSGRIHALVTAPISKEAWHLAGHKYDGHTGLLAELTGCSSYRMTFVSEKLNVMRTTTHIPLCSVCSALSVDRIRETINLAHRFMQDMGVAKPRIAICGVNPHAGEAGIFGSEEEQLVAPAILSALDAGLAVSGPVPADTVFLRAVRGEFDLVVAHYHDQGLIPVKLLAFDTAVNVTVGLPIIRTSVDHGTAFDIAGRGVASSLNLCRAIDCAVTMAKVRAGGKIR